MRSILIRAIVLGALAALALAAARKAWAEGTAVVCTFTTEPSSLRIPEDTDPTQCRARFGAASRGSSLGRITRPRVVLLLAFTHVTWPLPFEQYRNLTECQRERAAFIRKFGDEMAAHGMTLACVEPGRPAERGRSEFRASPL